MPGVVQASQINDVHDSKIMTPGVQFQILILENCLILARDI